jgi:hypothetical protein
MLLAAIVSQLRGDEGVSSGKARPHAYRPCRRARRLSRRLRRRPQLTALEAMVGDYVMHRQRQTHATMTDGDALAGNDGLSIELLQGDERRPGPALPLVRLADMAASHRPARFAGVAPRGPVRTPGFLEPARNGWAGAPCAAEWPGPGPILSRGRFES